MRREAMTDSMLHHIEEPRLAFRYGQELEHPKDGLFLFGPLDDRANPAETAYRRHWDAGWSELFSCMGGKHPAVHSAEGSK